MQHEQNREIQRLVLIALPFGRACQERQDYTLTNQQIAQLLHVKVLTADIIVLSRDDILVYTTDEFAEISQKQSISARVYQVQEVYPRTEGVITEETTIVLGRPSGTESLDDEPTARFQDYLLSSQLQVTSLHACTFKNSCQLSQLSAPVEPCPSLFCHDSIVVLRNDIMKKNGLISGQRVMISGRVLYTVSDCASSFLSNELSQKIRGVWKNHDELALVSPALYYNLGCPIEVSLVVDTPENDTGALKNAENIVVHPLNSYDLYSSSIALAAEESVQQYILQQKPCLSWVKGDILTVPIKASSAQAKFELEFARSKDLVEHHSNLSGGRLLYFEVANSGCGDASVIMGSATSFGESRMESLLESSFFHKKDVHLLPPVYPSHIISSAPQYRKVRDLISRLCRSSLQQWRFPKGSLKAAESTNITGIASNKALIQESEGNWGLDFVLAALKECGRQPVLLRVHGVPIEDIAKATRVCCDDPSNSLILDVPCALDTVPLSFFDSVDDLITSLPQNIPVIVHIGSLECPLSFSNEFPYKQKIENPSKVERGSVISSIFDHFSLSATFSAEDLVEATNHMSCSDIMAIIGAFPSGYKPTKEEIDGRITKHAKNIGIYCSGSNIDSVNWEDIGGLEKQKRLIMTRLSLPVNCRVKNSGILLHGPPGCGKTLLAKAVASEFKIAFINVKGPELLNMYVGQSEKNVKETFQKARECSPCILFFDEIDSIAPNRSHQGEANGVMNRVVAQLLTELDGIHSEDSSARIFVFGATNRIDLIDKSLLRPGRFEFSCFLGPPSSKNEIVQTLHAVVRKLKLGDDVSLPDLVDAIPRGIQFTGADLKGIVSNALLDAYEESASFEIQQRHLRGAMLKQLASSDVESPMC